MLKAILVFLFLGSACFTSSFPKGKVAEVKVRQTSVSIQDNMNPLHPFIF